MKKWQYKTCTKQADMNKLGSSGWELVAVSNYYNVEVFYFKREESDDLPKIIPGCEPTCDHKDPGMVFHHLYIEGDRRYGYCGTFDKEMSTKEVEDFIKRNKISDLMIKKGAV